eukprot:1216093-Rhodomonas_salina.3
MLIAEAVQNIAQQSGRLEGGSVDFVGKEGAKEGGGTGEEGCLPSLVLSAPAWLVLCVTTAGVVLRAMRRLVQRHA